MKFCKLPMVVIPMVFALISACITPGGHMANETKHSIASRGLTENDLNNATYRIDELGTFQLDNGEFQHQYGEGKTERHKVTLEKIAFGDLDHDGLSDAAVILTWQSGGSGAFKYLVAMRNTGHAPWQQDSVLLGDRVQIRALSIGAGQVSIDMVMTGPHDPMCCPTQQVKQTYRLRDGKWVQIADKAAYADTADAAHPKLTGILWKWTSFEGKSDNNDFVIDDPDKYTLILLPNGFYRAKSDCNRMQGQYTLEGRRIKIAPGAATLAECEPGSRYVEYQRYLSDAVSFVLHENKLVLNLMKDGESLVFGHGGEVSESHRY